MTEVQQTVQTALARFRGIRRKRAWLAAFAALAVVMVLAAVLDRTWLFSGWARWAGWIAGLAVAAWAARRAAGPTCPDATTLAHQIETNAGATAPVVATAIDPAVRRAAGNEALAVLLVDRLDLRAAETLRAAPPTFRGRLRVPAVLAGAAAVALVVLVAVQGANGLRRMVFPWQTSPYTALALERTAEPLAEGRAFTLTARVSGLPVKKVTLFRQDSPEPLAEAAPDPQGLVRLAVEGLDGPADFVVRGGDAQSAPLRVEPYLLPRIKTFQIAVTPPAYAGRAAKTETTPSFAVLRASGVRYRLHLQAPAVSVAVERSAAPPKEERVARPARGTFGRGFPGSAIGKEEPAAPAPAAPVFRPDPTDPLVWESDWDVSAPEDIVYRLVIKGGHGDQVRNDEPWRINVLKDAPPEVHIQSHNGAEVIRLGNEDVTFKLSAVDDVRLAGARLVFRKPGQPYTSEQIKLPPDTGRTWSGAELLALAPLDVKPLDIIAVHVEAEDSNNVDGPGVGRSEVVYLKVPLPESDDGGGGGGGGGSGPPPVNPLEIQMEILQSTIVLRDDAPVSDRAALAHDQRQNGKYAGMMEAESGRKGFKDLAAALRKARVAMTAAAQVLDQQVAAKAVPDEEAALGALIEAAKLLEDAKGAMAPGEGEGKLSFSLSSPRPKSPAGKGQNDKKEGENQEVLRKLMEEVQRQLAEQEKLNKGDGGEAGARAQKQQALAQDARSAAAQAGNLPAPSKGRGNPKAAAAELERAAGLQGDAAEALAGGEGPAGSQLGAQSAEALTKALRELAAQLKTGTFEGGAYPPGFERLVSDYLRSISYE